MKSSIMGKVSVQHSPCAGKHVAQLEVLYEISKVLATHSDQREMLQSILNILEERMEMKRVTIMLLTADGSELVVEAVRQDAGEFVKNARYAIGEGITGKVLETGNPEIVPLVSREPRFKGRVYKRNDSESINISFICVPVRLGNETVGTLSTDLPPLDMAILKEYTRVLTIVASIIANDVYQRRMARKEREFLECENKRLRGELEDKFRPENIIGNSGSMRKVFLRIHQVASSDTTVLIRGESGTGKELVASAIHYNSNRSEFPFIKLNCAALSENLLESELFGHEKGAFTGASQRRVGRIEQAEGGTLFLDEIGDFSPAVQVKLLRVIQEKEFERVGSGQTQKANVRIIAATNRDLEQAVQTGDFRQDLYYRINVFPVFLPPLRERKDDILLLANHFVRKYSEKMNKEIKRISTPAINMLTSYHWPGNVRELENCIEHAVLLSSDGVMHGYTLPPTLQMPESKDVVSLGALKQKVAVLEREMIVEALKRSKGNVCAAARELGITGRMVRYKIDNLKIDYRQIFNKKKKPRKKI
jgi:Nif-specific regulatory protein